MVWGGYDLIILEDAESDEGNFHVISTLTLGHDL